MSEKYNEILFKQAQDLAVLKHKTDLAIFIADEIKDYVGQGKYVEAAVLASVLAKITDA